MQDEQTPYSPIPPSLRVFLVRWRGTITRDVGQEYVVAYSADEAKRICASISDARRDVTSVTMLEEPVRNVAVLFASVEHQGHDEEACEYVVGVYVDEQFALQIARAREDRDSWRQLSKLTHRVQIFNLEYARHV